MYIANFYVNVLHKQPREEGEHLTREGTGECESYKKLEPDQQVKNPESNNSVIIIRIP